MKQAQACAREAPTRPPGAARRCRPARGVRPRGRSVSPRGLRGGRRLLRSLGLPHHGSAALGGPKDRTHLTRRLLRQAGETDPPRRGADAHRDEHRSAPPAQLRARPRRGPGQRVGGALLVERAFRAGRQRLLRAGTGPLPAPALLVALAGGAVLPRVARPPHAHPVRAHARTTGPSADAPRDRLARGSPHLHGRSITRMRLRAPPTSPRRRARGSSRSERGLPSRHRGCGPRFGSS